MMILKHEADGVAAELGQRRFWKHRRFILRDAQPSDRRTIEKSDNVEQRTLSRARGSHQRRELAGRMMRSMPCKTSVSTAVPTL